MSEDKVQFHNPSDWDKISPAHKEVLSSAWAKLNKHENHAIRAKLVKRLKDERPDIYTPFWHGGYTSNFSPDTHKAINASRNWLAAAFIREDVGRYIVKDYADKGVSISHEEALRIIDFRLGLEEIRGDA